MIGVRGGTFDPIHIAHLRVTLEVAEKLQLDQVHMIPGKKPPHRDPTQVDAAHRLEMVRLGIDGLAGFIADDRECRREGFSYTVDTLEELRAEYPDEPIVFIVGPDAFESLPEWHQWERIPELAHLAVTARPGYDTSQPPDWAAGRLAESAEELGNNRAGKIHFLETSKLSISATKIRRLRAANRDIRFLVPDAVYDYIAYNQLYRQ